MSQSTSRQGHLTAATQRKKARERLNPPADWKPLDDYDPVVSAQLLKVRPASELPACTCGCVVEPS
jgi:hypothetical protein